MAHYIDGFVLPVPRDRLDEYRRLAEAAAKIWKEHGALDYREYVGDDLEREGTRSFIDVVAATANEKVAADPRMVGLVESSNTGFDARRVAYAGFQALAGSSDANTG